MGLSIQGTTTGTLILKNYHVSKMPNATQTPVALHVSDEISEVAGDLGALEVLWTCELAWG